MRSGSFLVRKCSIAGVEAIEASTNHVFSRHTHDSYAIGRIVRGGQRSWSGRGLVEARQGNLISSNPGEVHDGHPLGVSRAWKMLYISPALVSAIADDLGDEHPGELEFVQPVFDRSSATAAFERCYAAVTGALTDSLAAESALALLFAEFVASTRPRFLPSSQRLRRAKERIDSDPAASITLDELARATGLSRYQVVRGFTRLTGLPPHSYVIQRRLELARNLIARGIAVSAASAEAGFADQSHLHRAFVRRFGMTPGGYATALR